MGDVGGGGATQAGMGERRARAVAHEALEGCAVP
jgi:hypothetical protein